MNNEEARLKLYEKVSNETGRYTDTEIEKDIDVLLAHTSEAVKAQYPDQRYLQALNGYPASHKFLTGEGAPAEGGKDASPLKTQDKDKERVKYKAEKHYKTSVETPAAVLSKIKEIFTTEDFDKLCEDSKGIGIKALIRKRPSTEELAKNKIFPTSVTVGKEVWKKIITALGDDIETKLVECEKVPNSKENFARLKALCEKGGKAAVYLTDKLPSIAGAVLIKGADKTMSTYNKERLQYFCQYEIANVINPSKETGIGCEARAVKNKKQDGQNDNAEEFKTTFRFRFTGTKEDKNDPDHNIFYTMPKKGADGKLEYTTGTVTLGKEFWFAYKKDATDEKVSIYKPKVSIDTYPKFVLDTESKYHFGDQFVVKQKIPTIPDKGREREDLYNDKINLLIDISAGEVDIQGDIDEKLAGIINKIRDARTAGVKEAKAEIENAL